MASLAAITVNAARSSTASTHVYSSSSITGNITGIIGGSTGNGYSADPGYTTNIVGFTGNNTTSIFSVSTGNTTGNTTSSYETHATGIVGSSPVNVYSTGTGSDTGTAISSSRGLGNTT